MNPTPPRAERDITVLRTRQLQATKLRIIAEFRALGISSATVEYRADPSDPGDVRIRATHAEDDNGNALVLEHPIEAAFYDIATLVERFALDVVAHHHSGIECDGGGYGFVTIQARRATVRIENTSIETNEVSEETEF